MLDPLDRPATAPRLRVAIAALGGDEDALARALALAHASPPPRAWSRYLHQALLLVGTALALAGTVCFFAYNWERLGRFTRFAALEAALAACAAFGWWRLPALAGRAALFAAAVLVGPLLGVFGQTYHTGADPWGLFAAWAALIVPWVVAARFAALWLLLAALCDTALFLFWFQVPALEEHTSLLVFVAAAAFHAAAIAGWEWQLRRSSPWLDEPWLPRLLAAAGFVFLLVPTAALVLGADGPGPLRLAGLFAWLTALGAVLAYYRTIRPDLAMLTLAGASALVVLTLGVGRAVFWGAGEPVLGLLFMAVFILAEVTLAVSWLRRAIKVAR